MNVVGIICEYNPFHNGHVYHIQKVRELFPNSPLLLVLNGYFLERGEISCLSKKKKTELALEYGVDLVIGLPVIFGTQAADIFALKSLEILNYFQVTDVVFGSECNNISYLEKLAKKQLEDEFDSEVKTFLKDGINYPTALSKALHTETIMKEPNDLLGISYLKAALKNHWNIRFHTILRTNGYHDLSNNSSVVSASNIRTRIQKQEDISSYVPFDTSYLLSCNQKKMWQFLKFRILTEPNLSQYMTVDEGIENRLKKMAFQAHSLEEFITLIKTKRYTYNRIHRMIVHLLLGFTKQDNDSIQLDYLQILGFTQRGQKYLKKLRDDIPLPFRNPYSKIYYYEKIASYLYDEFMNSHEYSFELQNKPIVKQ